MVSYQAIKENTQVKKGTEVVVWISMGEEKGVIPAVTGKSREEAETLLSKAGFSKVRIEESQKTGVYESVLKVSEAEGDNVILEKEIVLTVCMNKENSQGDATQAVKVPALSGLSRAEAENAAKEAGLKVNWIEEFSSQPEGSILGQEPEAEAEANKDSYVNVRICKGVEKIYMKNVQLMEQSEAEAVIKKLGLSVGKVTESYSDNVAAGKVIAQSIGQDEETAKGAHVDLTISKGKDPEKAKAESRKREAAAAEEKRKAEEAAAAEEAKRRAEESAAAEAKQQSEEAAEAEKLQGESESPKEAEALQENQTTEAENAPQEILPSTQSPETQQETDSRKNVIEVNEKNIEKEQGPAESSTPAAEAPVPTEPLQTEAPPLGESIS